MDPVVTSSLISAGAGFASSLADRIFGSGDDKRKERFIEWLKNKYNTPVLSDQEQNTIASNLFNANAGVRNRFAEAAARRTGLDSGVARGEIARFATMQDYGFRASLAQLAAQLKAQQNNAITGQIGATVRSF